MPGTQKQYSCHTIKYVYCMKYSVSFNGLQDFAPLRYVGQAIRFEKEFSILNIIHVKIMHNVM